MGSRGGSDLCSFLLKAAAAGLLSQNVFATEDDHNSTTTTVVNGTVTKPTYAAGDLVEWFSSNNEMLLRMSYVLLAVTLLIVLYFAVKTCR